jgi:O-6-methylguanine DNA methyltransferase
MRQHRSLPLTVSDMPSPVGRLCITYRGDTVYYIAFDVGDSEEMMKEHLERHLPSPLIFEHAPLIRSVQRELEQYFEGTRKRFTIRTQLLGTDFQLQVWTAVRSIPYGSTASYKNIAVTIGNPTATRAVGQAVGRNPIPIIIPCHRVIGEDGKLVGFGGGIDRKRRLLRLERTLLV